MKLVYPALFTPCEELTGYTVTVPDLPGCITEGRNLAEAIEMGIDAASGWILDEIEDGNSYPAASKLQDISVPDGSFVNFLITIPAWLNTYGEKNNINFSKVLQNALIESARKA